MLPMLSSVPTDAEIQACFLAFNNDKSPGPDGFNAHFYQMAWPVVGRDVINAIRTFFVNGKLLKEVNNFYIALVPKTSNPTTLNDFRPISCCNTLYKCIAKLIANKLKNVLPSIIDSFQNAFIKGKHIGDSVLLAQKLLQGYHKQLTPPRGAMKVDFMKAFDSVGCRRLAISHLIFVDDLLLFSYSDLASAATLKQALDHFTSLSGLKINCSKSKFFISRVGNTITEDIKNLLRFDLGSLPNKYLTVPLIATRLKASNCRGLVENVTRRVTHWSSNFLSYVGRIQLIQSVLYSMVNYWSSLFVLPKSVLAEVIASLETSYEWGQNSNILGPRLYGLQSVNQGSVEA
ncbi:uncharacterized protein LOC132282327 [Cornus florida]|uniref:uncharacterized protein LOC132282327 n=1 Tax=Cornus florida TaxID=4283 RepID=UPI00289E2776|nr:uncharacterized protein LOC132282327 [Cornus florida]